MDKYENAVEQLKSGIKTYIDKKTIEIPCDRTFTALVTKINQNGTYEILLNGVKYNNIKTIGGTCYVNETVKVLVPQNNYNNMFILKAIEDVGNYKLFDYTNDKGIKIVSNDVPERKWYRFVNADSTDPNNRDCWLYIDDEYYVDDTEEYLYTKDLKAKGACFCDRKVDTIWGEQQYGYYTSELKKIFYTSAGYNKENSRVAGWFRRRGYNSSWTNQGSAIDFLGQVATREIHNFEKGKTKYLEDEGDSNEQFPSHAVKPDYTTTHGWYWGTDWGEAADGTGYSGWGIKNWGGWITANFPIFGLDCTSDVYYQYVYGTDEEAKAVLPLAVNYKPTKYQEIFATSFLMNEKAKVKVDVECLANYNEKNYNLYLNEKELFCLNIGQDYGHGFFKLDERPFKKIKYEVENLLYNTYGEHLKDYIITMASTSEDNRNLSTNTKYKTVYYSNDYGKQNIFFDENTNEKICVRFSTLIQKPYNNSLGAHDKNYIRYVPNLTYENEERGIGHICFDVYHSFMYIINSDGTYEKVQGKDKHEVHTISMLLEGNNYDYSAYISEVGKNFYKKNGTWFPIKNTFIYNYPIYLSAFSDNYIYRDCARNINSSYESNYTYKEGQSCGRLLMDDTFPLISVFGTDNTATAGSDNTMRFAIKNDGKFYEYNSNKFKNFHKINQNFNVQYYINDKLVATQPAGTFNYGENILRLMRTISSDSSGLQKLSIRLGLIDGEVEIDPNDILVTISGAGLIDQTYFSGDIEIEEEFSPITPINPTVVEYEEDVDVVIVERPTMRDYTWGELITNRITWQKAKDEYIW